MLGDKHVLYMLMAGMLLVPAAAAAENANSSVFTVELTVYENETVVLEQFEITDGSQTPARGPGAYPHTGQHNHTDSQKWQEHHWLVTVDEDGYVHDARYIPFSFTDAPDVEHPDAVRQIEDVFERLPYTADAERIHLVRGEDDILYTLDIPDQVCIADGTCHVYCDGRGADPDCDDHTQYAPWIIISLLLLITASVLYHVLQR